MQIDRTRMYRVSAVAELCDLSPSTVYRAIESGALDAMRFGNALRVSGDSLAAWFDQCAEAGYAAHVVAGESAADVDAADQAGDVVEGVR